MVFKSVVYGPFIFLDKILDHFFHHQIRNEHVRGQLRTGHWVEMADFLKVLFDI